MTYQKKYSVGKKSEEWVVGNHRTGVRISNCVLLERRVHAEGRGDLVRQPGRQLA